MKPEWILCPSCREIIIMKEKDMHQEGIPGKWIPRELAEFAKERNQMRAIIKEMGNLLEDFYDFHATLTDKLPIGTVENTFDVLDKSIVKQIMRP